MRLDPADRHLLAVAAVWLVLAVVGLPLGAAVCGLALRVFLVVSGVGS